MEPPAAVLLHEHALRSRTGRRTGHARAPPARWRRWLHSTNHKDIGTMYLLFSFTMFVLIPVLRKKGEPAPFHTFETPPDKALDTSPRVMLGEPVEEH